MLKLTLILVNYLIGSIPFGFLIAQGVKKIDIRNFGSGNIGATNVFRIVGKKWGLLVFFLDFLKGFAGPCLVASLLPESESLIIVLSSIATVCGHNWTVFLNFKGGKGVATSLGAVIGLGFVFSGLWLAIGVAFIFWLIVFSISRFVSLASLAAGASFTGCVLCSSLPIEIKVFSFLLLVSIIARHKNNIKNLIAKKENRL